MKSLALAIEALKCLAMAFLCGALLGALVLIWRTPKIINKQADATRTALVTELQGTRSDAYQLVASMVDEAATVEGDLDGEVSTALDLLDKRSGEALAAVSTAAAQTNAQLSETNRQFSQTNNTIAETLKPFAETAQQVDDALPLFADCEFNPDCAFNRFQGASKAVEQTAIVIASEAPKMTASVDRIAASSAGVAASADATGKEVAIAAKRFNAPQTLLQKIQQWLIVGAKLAGAFL